MAEGKISVCLQLSVQFLVKRNISANIYFVDCVNIYLEVDWTADTTQQQLLVAL